MQLYAETVIHPSTLTSNISAIYGRSDNESESQIEVLPAAVFPIIAAGSIMMS